MRIGFVWDDRKARENFAKHRVSFAEAATVFRNFPLEVYYDPDHSSAEARFIAVGFSDRGRVLLVVHMENVTGTEIRIISARRATVRERRTAFGGFK